MTLEAQRIAIAEKCGYFHAKRGIDVWYEPDGGHVVFGDLPDYLNDLNAMHEAEKMLNRSQRADYRSRLKNLFTPERDRYTSQNQFDGVICHATAAQRAEAFLRTLKLWID